jgi:TPR repeat protein
MTQVQTSLDDLTLRAEGGEPEAQYSLGVLFLLGEVMEQDLDASYQWLAKAACGQHPDAQLLVEKLAPRHFGAVSVGPGRGKLWHDSIVRRLRGRIWSSKQSRSLTSEDPLSWIRGGRLRFKIRFKQDAAGRRS